MAEIKIEKKKPVKIRNVGMIVTKGLRTIQQQKFPDLPADLDNLEASVNIIKPETETLDQKEEVKNFFRTASDVLTKMKQ